MKEDNCIILDKFPDDWKYCPLTYPVAKYRHLSLNDIIREMDSCNRSFCSIPNIVKRLCSSLLKPREPRINLVGKLSYRCDIGVDNKAFNDFKRQQGDRWDQWIIKLEDLCLFDMPVLYRMEFITDPLWQLEKVTQFHNAGEFEARDGGKRGRSKTTAFTAYGMPSDLAWSNRCFEIGWKACSRLGKNTILGRKGRLNQIFFVTARIDQKSAKSLRLSRRKSIDRIM